MLHPDVPPLSRQGVTRDYTMLFFRYSGLLDAQQPLMASVAILAPLSEREGRERERERGRERDRERERERGERERDKRQMRDRERETRER